jgi:acetyl-CoA carboxylase biotin carboxyl carrier protein
VDNNHQPRNPEPTLAEAADAVRKLAAVLDDHQLAQIDVSLGKLNIRIKAGKNGEHLVQQQTPSEPVSVPIASEPEGHLVAAPMIGTFYSAPSPGEPAFVSVGDIVEAGQVIGIIEAMKIMNEIAADRAGTVAEIYVKNSQSVEYGSPLIRLT